MVISRTHLQNLQLPLIQTVYTGSRRSISHYVGLGAFSFQHRASGIQGAKNRPPSSRPHPDPPTSVYPPDPPVLPPDRTPAPLAPPLVATAIAAALQRLGGADEGAARDGERDGGTEDEVVALARDLVEHEDPP